MSPAPICSTGHLQLLVFSILLSEGWGGNPKMGDPKAPPPVLDWSLVVKRWGLGRAQT